MLSVRTVPSNRASPNFSDYLKWSLQLCIDNIENIVKKTQKKQKNKKQTEQNKNKTIKTRNKKWDSYF